MRSNEWIDKVKLRNNVVEISSTAIGVRRIDSKVLFDAVNPKSPMHEYLRELAERASLYGKPTIKFSDISLLPFHNEIYGGKIVILPSFGEMGFKEIIFENVHVPSDFMYDDIIDHVSIDRLYVDGNLMIGQEKFSVRRFYCWEQRVKGRSNIDIIVKEEFNLDSSAFYDDVELKVKLESQGSIEGFAAISRTNFNGSVSLEIDGEGVFVLSNVVFSRPTASRIGIGHQVIPIFNNTDISRVALRGRLWDIDVIVKLAVKNVIKFERLFEKYVSEVKNLIEWLRRNSGSFQDQLIDTYAVSIVPRLLLREKHCIDSSELPNENLDIRVHDIVSIGSFITRRASEFLTVIRFGKLPLHWGLFQNIDRYPWLVLRDGQICLNDDYVDKYLTATKALVKTVVLGAKELSEFELTWSELSVATYRLVLENYRILRANLDYFMDYENSGGLFVSELEFKRKYELKNNIVLKKSLFKRLVSVYTLYLILSLYGESYRLPLMHILLSWLSTIVGVVVSTGKVTITTPFDALLLLAGYKSISELLPGGDKSFIEILLFMLRTYATIASGNLVIALRRKFERRIRG